MKVGPRPARARQADARRMLAAKIEGPWRRRRRDAVGTVEGGGGGLAMVVQQHMTGRCKQPTEADGEVRAGACGIGKSGVRTEKARVREREVVGLS